MKVRSGFISNSSSSSFLMYGIKLDGQTEFIDSLKASLLEGKVPDDFDIETFELENSDLGDDMVEILDKAGLNVEIPPDDQYYIGMSLAKIGLNETRLQFQERVKAKLLEYFKKIPKKLLDTYEECWGPC